MAEAPSEKASEVVEIISGAGGAVAGVAVTLAAGPFVGSASGEVVAGVLRRVGHEIERRVLGPRQERRIARALQAAANSAEVQLEAGYEVRSDGFFVQRGPDGDSPADELLEGVLRTAADAWDQKKVPYIGNMFSGVSFETDISAADAAYFIKLAERLTYQQVVLIAFFEEAQDYETVWRNEVISASVRVGEGMSLPTPMIRAEMNDLATIGLLGVRDSDGRSVRVGETIGSMGGFGTYGDGVALTEVQPTDMGQTLHRLMGLDQVPESDLWMIARALHGHSGPVDPDESEN